MRPRKTPIPNTSAPPMTTWDNGVDELATHKSVADEGDGNEFASNAVFRL